MYVCVHVRVCVRAYYYFILSRDWNDNVFCPDIEKPRQYTLHEM